MIAKNLIYQKSAKGSEAIATRQHGLSPKLRSMLILIDGKRDCQELLRISGMLGEIEQLVSQLLEQGCIEPVAKAARAVAPVSAPAPISANASAPSGFTSLSDARRHAVRRLIEIVGPNADEICMRIESSRSVPDFTAAIARAEAMVREFRGANAAGEFAAEIRAHLPS